MTRAAEHPGRLLDRIRRDRGTRPLTAVVMVALVLGVYAAAVGIGLLFGRSGPPGLLLSIVATAVVALAFEPVRTRTYRLFARLTGRNAIEAPQDVLAHFTDSVGGRYPVQELPRRIAATLGRGTQAVRAEVWLIVHGRLEPAAEWPESTATSSAGPPPAEEQRHSLDVIERGELLGRLTVVTRPGQDLNPVERRLFAGVAAQAGLILRVAGLRTELQQRLAELEQRSGDLRRSRREIVTRQDAERQRLERDIHDGAQQEVLALLVNLRLAQTLLGRAPDRAVGVLAQQAAATRATIRTLEELSRGLYPATLGESGPVPALRAAAARGAVPVTIIAPELPRLPAHVEATLYFGCLEALQNAAKHASATQVTVHVRPLASGDGDGIGGVEAQIIDDGVGFDATGAGFIAGRGLQNLRDRVDAAHGALDISSAPGTGTRLVFSVPVLPAPVFPTVFSAPDGGSA